LQRKSGGAGNSTPTPVDTILNKPEINSSDRLTSSENKDKKGKLANNLSALRGSSPDGSTIERTRSEDLKYSYKYPSSGDESFNSFFQDATPKHPSKVSPIKQDTSTDPKMASPDLYLEFVIIDLMGFTLTHPSGLALPQSYVTTFDEFRSVDVDDVYEFQYTDKLKSKSGTKLHFMLVKQVQRCVHYTCYKEGLNDVQSDNPTLWSKTKYSTWCRNGYTKYIETFATTTATSTPLPVTSTTER
jgi:hypothetical protein